MLYMNSAEKEEDLDENSNHEFGSCVVCKGGKKAHSES